MTKEEILKVMPGHSAAIPLTALARADRGEETGSMEARMAELEVENMRLQRLVAELLIKNQQLRKCDG